MDAFIAKLSCKNQDPVNAHSAIEPNQSNRLCENTLVCDAGSKCSTND